LIPWGERSLQQDNVPSPKHTLNLLLSGLAGGVIATAILIVVFRYWPNTLVRGGMSYAELATIVLTGVAVLITILGVFVAILAVWGFGNFEELAKRAAKAHVRDQIKTGKLKFVIESATNSYLEEEFAEDGRLLNILYSRVDAIILNDASRRSGGPGSNTKIELVDEDGED
jgi:hypothetical protein